MAWWQRIPISIVAGVPLLLIAGGWFGYRAWRQSLTILTFVPPDGMAAPELELTFYPDQLAFASRSPAAAIGRQRAPAGEVVLDAALVADNVIVRYAGSGVGTGFVRVVPRRPGAPVLLRGPTRLRGRVGEPQGFFCFGLRALGLRAVVGARVLAMGGGEHGVLLGEAVTDAEGRYEIAGFAEGLPNLGVRVLAAGHAMQFVATTAGGDEPTVALVATQPIAGKVALPPGVDPKALRVLAKGLPGVEAAVGDDGAFALDHVAPNLEPRLLVHGLPPSWTHAQVHAMPGDANVAIAVVPAARVRGRVVDRNTLLPIAGAMVWHEHGPAGWVAVDADSDGRFELELAPAGSLLVRAQRYSEDALGNRETLFGERRIDIEAGKDVDGLVVRVD